MYFKQFNVHAVHQLTNGHVCVLLLLPDCDFRFRFMPFFRVHLMSWILDSTLYGQRKDAANCWDVSRVEDTCSTYRTSVLSRSISVTQTRDSHSLCFIIIHNNNSMLRFLLNVVQDRTWRDVHKTSCPLSSLTGGCALHSVDCTACGCIRTTRANEEYFP